MSALSVPHLVFDLFNQLAAGLPSSVSNVPVFGTELFDAELVGALELDLPTEETDEALLLATLLHTPALVCAPSIFSESILAKPSAVSDDSCTLLLPCTRSISMLAVCQVVQPPVVGNCTV